MARSLIRNESGTHSRTDKFPGVVPPRADQVFTYPYSYQSKNWTRSDVVKTPRDPDGWRKPTAYSSSDTELDLPYGSQETVSAFLNGKLARSELGHVSIGADTGWRLLSVAESPSEISRLTIACLEKAKDTTFNLAVSLAELGSTIDLVASNAVKLYSALRAAKRFQWSEVYRILGVRGTLRNGSKDLSKGWLEVIYGWLPLISDVYSAVDELGKKNSAEGFVLVARAQSVTSDEEVKKVGLTGSSRYLGSNSAFRIGSSVATNSRRTTHKVAMWFRVDLPQLKRASALGLTNPASVIWELVPFSFVADWFLPIGDWLATLDATLGLKYLGGTSVYHEYSFSLLVIAPTVIPQAGVGNYISSSATPGTWKKVTSNRKVLDATPSPFYLKNPFSVARAVTSVALLRQTYKPR